MNEWVNEWMNEWVNKWMNEWINANKKYEDKINCDLSNKKATFFFVPTNIKYFQCSIK